MSPTHHVIASAITSAAFYCVNPSLPATAGCFLSGIFIDLDHVVDLWVHKKKLFFTVKELFRFCEVEKEGKLRLWLHSYELLFLFWAAIYVFHLGSLWIGIALGLTVHMILDQIFNPVKPLVYFLAYRIRHNFSRECTFNEATYRKLME